MNAYRFNQLANIHVALSTLRQFNQYVLFPVPEKEFDNPIILDYFLSQLDSSTEKTVEKMVCVAAVKYIFDNPNIPAQNKEQSAKNTARDIREVMRYAKLEYHAKVQNLSIPEYNRRKRSILIVKRIAKIKKAKEILKIASITKFATFDDESSIFLFKKNSLYSSISLRSINLFALIIKIEKMSSLYISFSKTYTNNSFGIL